MPRQFRFTNRRSGNHIIPGSVSADPIPEITTNVIRITDNGPYDWLSMRYSGNSKLSLPDDDLGLEDPDCYVVNPELEIHNYQSVEHALMVQKFHTGVISSGKIDKILNMKYFEYREIIRYLVSIQDIVAMGTMEGSQDRMPQFRIDTPHWIIEKFQGNSVAGVIKEYQDLGVTIRSDWDQVKENIGFILNDIKFEQNPELRKKLIATAGYKLVNYSGDSFWSILDVGSNKLGWILMTLRDLQSAHLK